MTYDDIMKSNNLHKRCKNYSVQLIDTKTKRNITKKHFKECLLLYGYEKTCNVFKKLSANFREELM
jgi:hypothetical protein